jgi:hypothetical protein
MSSEIIIKEGGKNLFIQSDIFQKEKCENRETDTVL